MKLSLIIATYNRSAQLLNALQSVAAQSRPSDDWECIVVDNNSTDDTQQAFGLFAAAHPSLNLHIATETRQGLSYARNRGIAESRGEYIAIIDDDEHINSRFVEAYIDLFDSHPEYSVAGGRVIAEYPEGRPTEMSHYIEVAVANPTDWGDRIREFPAGRIPAGGNMAFRRETLMHYGGFDTSLGRSGGKLTGGEESDLFERLKNDGVRFVYVPDAIIWHVIPPSKLNDDYLRRLAAGTGASQRRRAMLHNRLGRLYAAEAVKWGATLLLAAWFALTLRPAKSRWLLIMRAGITRGIAAR